MANKGGTERPGGTHNKEEVLQANEVKTQKKAKRERDVGKEGSVKRSE
jgi:hypothetical protein